MSVRLNWNNRSEGDSVKVYRDTARFDFAGRPAALVTLAADAMTYLDETAPAGTQLFYAVSAVSGASEAMGGIIEVNTATVPAGDALLLESGDLLLLESGDLLLLE